MRLLECDVAALQRALLALHEERDVEGFREAMPGILKELVPADWLIWLDSGFGDADFREPIRNLVVWEQPRMLKPKHVRFATGELPDHPFTRHALATGDWGPLRLGDFLTRRQLVTTPLYRELLAPFGMGRLMSVGIFRGNRFGTLNFLRREGAREFSERDRELLRLAVPHYVQALGAAERLGMLRGERARALPSLGLTPREVDVATWLARSRTNAEIATILAMKPRTVEKHVENILFKLGVENRTAAAMLVSGMVGIVSNGATTRRRRGPAR